MAILRPASGYSSKAVWYGVFAAAAGVNAVLLGLSVGGLGGAPRAEARDPLRLHFEAVAEMTAPESAAFRGSLDEQRRRSEPGIPPPGTEAAPAPPQQAPQVLSPRNAPPQHETRAQAEAQTFRVSVEDDSQFQAAEPARTGSQRATGPSTLDAADRPLEPVTVVGERTSANADAESSSLPQIADLREYLSGKPDYPRSCRRGECRHGDPCEGRCRFRVTVREAGGLPQKVDLLQSAGCRRLDDRALRWLEKSNIGVSGVGEVDVLFVIEDR
ncbi:MAG: hypothetical protein L6R28_09635 [Planctomycetes bacterium]|nr:hypothetical protein [Planctomycetota bacterium]